MSGFFDDTLGSGEIGCSPENEQDDRPYSMAMVLRQIETEVERAEAKHAPMHSAHEGYAVILEEVDELKAEVWKGGKIPRDPVAMRKEAVEVAAMAVRFIRDVCDGRNRKDGVRMCK